jgi:hypothetical protein
MSTAYVLYRLPSDDDTLLVDDMIKYLQHVGINAKPIFIYEERFPSWMKVFPCIVDMYENLFQGMDEVIKYYETVYGIDNILQKTLNFKDTTPPQSSSSI